ncbi:MAG TPA: HDOD domain-containing protein [Candidatus Latescibacteria bacterium]|nr:hypothetical protein [Gemmatimonadaceae bacterium]MDP6016372.1 HDOD domain-containing protein [Candidatus Latescibacterota bacterium]HJP34167.1 HDOD domain-containing protein [Candidatus Latescibacterota bacterium]
MDEQKRQRLKRITQSIIGLPTLPTVITELISLIDNPKTNARKVAQLISTDQALTAKILKLANSAFYGFPREIATVDLAVVVLGFETVKNLGLSVSVLERFSGTDGGVDEFDRQKFWEHSIACGVSARLLAGKLRYRMPGEAFAAGILHDIGRLILSQYFPAEFSEVLQLMRTEDLYIGHAEEEVLGVTHAEVGSWLAERWNLPDQLEKTIAMHHAPGRVVGTAELPSLIHLADFLCRREKIGDGGGDKLPHLDPAALRVFGIHEEPVAALKRIFGYGEELQVEMAKRRLSPASPVVVTTTAKPSRRLRDSSHRLNLNSLVSTTPEPGPADPRTETPSGSNRARELLHTIADVNADVAWELGLHLDSLTESEKELQVRVGALEETNRLLQERLTSGQSEYAQLRASMDELLNLHDLSEAISTSFDVEDILDQLISLSGRVVAYEGAGVFSLVDEDARLEAISLRGEGELLQARVRTQWEDGIVDWVLREGRPIVIDDLESSDGHTFVFVPMRVRGKRIGLYALHCSRPKDDFTQSEIEMLAVLANQAAAAMENSRLYTDVEAAHQRLKQQQRQLLLSAKQAAIGELSGGVAHEVNNPLQIILSRVQLMLVQQARIEADNPKLVDGLELIESNVKRISRIIRALLGFASHNTIEAEGQPFGIAGAIQQACALTKHQLDQKMIGSQVQVEADLPDLFGNVGEIEQVFINLLLNAENAMTGGGHLAIDARRQDDWLEIRFQDNGPGIPADHIERIFEPFFTTRADSGGTGLGLAVSYRIIENHGGTITVESEPGNGACFIIRLPIPDSVAASDPNLSEP